MAQLTDLPEELLVMIIRKLDFKSQCTMYESCDIFKNLLCMHGVVLECNMSRSSVATVSTMRLDFFKDISYHLQVLNLCGVPDLTKRKVLPAFKKLKHLKVLDISYTNLNIIDLKAIHRACPTLKDIAIDFKFGILTNIEKIVQETQSLFKHFDNVHFVGSVYNLFESTLVIHVLGQCKADIIKFSAVEVENALTTVRANDLVASQLPPFNHFSAYMLSFWGSSRTHENFCTYPIVSMMDLKKYEFCVIYTMHTLDTSIYATPLFNDFFRDNFDVVTRSATDYKSDPKAGVALMVWNKKTTLFDDIFFQKLYRRVKPYFPFFCKAGAGDVCPPNYDWIYSYPRTNPNVLINLDYLTDRRGDGPKKRKTLIPNIILDYDYLLQNKAKAQLSLMFMPEQLVSAALPSDCDYFSKLTFLNVSGAVKYNADFFNDLFRWCNNLITLAIEMPGFPSCKYSHDVVHAIQASRSMKNLRLVDKGIDLRKFFKSLSKCKTLENINLVDLKQWDHCEIADPTELIQSCRDLYSVFIEAPFTEAAQNKQLKMFNKAKTSCKRTYVKVDINLASDNRCRVYGYNPFVDVFQLNPIKPS